MQRLTWHAASVLPYASLWHTVHRVAALNAMRPAELPFAVDASGDLPRARIADLLFNEARDNGECRPGEALSIRNFAAALGEPCEVFAWSHFGSLPASSRCLLHSFLRVCPACLEAGYHCSLFSLRLLGRCPIHQCEFLDTCLCGRRFDCALETLAALNAGSCTCSQTTYFTPETCRRPTMTAQETVVLRPIAKWLDAMSTVSRPVSAHPEHRRAHDRVFMSSLSSWCAALSIGYPAVLPLSEEGAEFCSSQMLLSSNSKFRSPLAHVPVDNAISDEKTRRRSLWRNTEATMVYRAMTRHLRKHVARGTEQYAREFMRRPNPLVIARTMQQSHQATVAFAELLFCHGMERFAMRRRWPYRNPNGDLWRLEDQLANPDIEVGHELAQGLTPAATIWLGFQSAAAMVTYAWRRAQNAALQAVSTGIADWRCPSEIDCNQSGTKPSHEPTWNWYSAPPPFQVTWASAVVGNSLRFLSSPKSARIDWTLPLPDKRARIEMWRRAEAARNAEVQAACQGPSLTWTSLDGWRVLEAAHPRGGAAKRHRLFVEKGEWIRFWLFAADRRFVARTCDAKLQTLGNTPREAVQALRTAVLQYRRLYRLAKPANVPLPIPTSRDGLELEREFDLRLMQCLCLFGFWGGAWRFHDIAVEHLVRNGIAGAEGHPATWTG